MTIPAGRRSSYLTMWLESSSSADAAGQFVPTYTKVCNVWGEVTLAAPPISATRIKGSQEEWVGYTQAQTVTHLVSIPFIPNYIGATGKFTETIRGTVFTYQVAGAPMIGSDIQYPVKEVVDP